MLPTKGYFQDIECPYYDSSCGRPYCHFRHKKRPIEIIEESFIGNENNVVPAVPTYKPTPKSELANIHNSRSHIPISYVPDLAFSSRPLRKLDKPTYKPTPISILSYAKQRSILQSDENGEHHDNKEVIDEIKQNIANNEYNPVDSLRGSAINFEDLSDEFGLIDEIISDSVPDESINDVNKTVDNEVENEEVHVNFQKTPSPGECEVQQSHTEEEKVENISLEYVPKEKKEESQKNLNDSKKVEVTSSGALQKADDVCSEKEKKEVSNRNVIDRKKTEVSSDKLHKGNDKNSISTDNPKSKSEKSSDRRKVDKKRDKDREKQKKSKEREKERSEKKKDKTHKSSRDKLEEKYKGHRKNKEEKIKLHHKSSDKHKAPKLSKEKERHKSKERSNEKGKHRSKDKSKERDRHKDVDRNKSKEREKRNKEEKREKKKLEAKSKSKDKGKPREKHKDRHKSSVSDKKEHTESKAKRHDKLRYIFSEDDGDSSDSSDNNITETFENNISDIDLDDEDETMLECYKIFNEYKPPEQKVEIAPSVLPPQNVTREDNEVTAVKKRVAHANAENSQVYTKSFQPLSKPKSISTPGQTLANRYKLAREAQANNEQNNIFNEIKQLPVKRPAAPSLLEAARKRKIERSLPSKPALNISIVDDIINGTSTSITTQNKVPRKIAPVQNVSSIQKAKARIQELAKQNAIAKLNKTTAQSTKSGRVAHVPEFELSDIPDVLQADKSKLPVNVRTRFLTMIVDECSKLYFTKHDAYARALSEEFSCYEKCKVLATYRNSAMLAVNRLRKEIQERNKLGLGFLESGETTTADKSSEFKGKRFYENVKRWVLTEEELDIHGYPRESEVRGVAVIKNRKQNLDSSLDENHRRCSRCKRRYMVDDDGWPLYDEECLYHPLKKRTIRGEQTYLCCKTSDDTGCATSDTHVTDLSEIAELDGFQTTLEPEREGDPRSYSVYALDCEMCYTTKGLELTRVTIIDPECKVVYESLVKPLNPIIDYNTTFSGITKEQMDRTSTNILQIQANILHLCNSKTILVGHSLESDLKALKIVHEHVIDTSVLFPHKMGLPHKRALKILASEYLKKIIQNDVGGHDSAEDAVACMELLMWKLKEELKGRHK